MQHPSQPGNVFVTWPWHISQCSLLQKLLSLHCSWPLPQLHISQANAQDLTDDGLIVLHRLCRFFTYDLHSRCPYNDFEMKFLLPLFLSETPMTQMAKLRLHRVWVKSFYKWVNMTKLWITIKWTMTSLNLMKSWKERYVILKDLSSRWAWAMYMITFVSTDTSLISFGIDSRSHGKFGRGSWNPREPFDTSQQAQSSFIAGSSLVEFGQTSFSFGSNWCLSVLFGASPGCNRGNRTKSRGSCH